MTTVEQFKSVLDELVLMAKDDFELSEGIKWIDAQSKKNGITFYEMAYMVIARHMADKRAKAWRSGK